MEGQKSHLAVGDVFSGLAKHPEHLLSLGSLLWVLHRRES